MTKAVTKEISPLSFHELTYSAKNAGNALASLPSQKRQDLLHKIAATLIQKNTVDKIMQANAYDLSAAQKMLDEGTLSEPLFRRLKLSLNKLHSLAHGINQLAEQKDKVSEITQRRRLDTGLILEKKTVPLGTLGVIFESRPDALPQIASIAFKTGNAVILKGGKEARKTNQCLVAILKKCCQDMDIDPRVITLLDTRQDVHQLIEQNRHVDLIIARGSAHFVEAISQKSKIPVLGHAEGLCHLVIDLPKLDPLLDPAKIAVDAKCSYPAACNAIETLLWVSGSEAALAQTVWALQEQGVEIRGCKRTREALLQNELKQNAPIKNASEEDWQTEYTDLILSIRAVPNLDKALEHIARYGSGHTEAIICNDTKKAERFLSSVDAACVFHNASTRFADGYRFGEGAEVGISTSKLHARGPVGTDGLLTYKWVLRGSGQASTDYALDQKEGKKSYLHQELTPQ